MFLRRIANGIPSWWLAVAGAFLVGVPAALGPVAIFTMDEEIQVNLKEVDEFEEKIQKLWNESVAFNQRMANIGTFLVLADQAENSTRQFVLERAAENATTILSNSFNIKKINAMSCIFGPPDDEGIVEMMKGLKVDAADCSVWYGQLGEGEIDAFRSVAKARIGMIEYFAEKIGKYKNEISKRRESVWTAKRQLKTVQILVASLSLIGLVLVLLKDVPIWKDTATKRSGNDG